MADAYVDLEQTASTATSPYETWAKAAADFQTAITQAGSGGRVFVRIDGDGVGTTKDTATGDRTLSFPGDDQVPFGLYGVKDATTATPPTDSDLCVRGTDALPVFETTSSGDITLDEATGGADVAYAIQGIRFDTTESLFLGRENHLRLVDCELDFDGGLFPSRSTFSELFNCELIFDDSSSHIGLQGFGVNFYMFGGLLSGTAPTNMIDQANIGFGYFYGVDMSLVTGTLFDLGGSVAGGLTIVNSKLAMGVTRVTGVTGGASVFVEVIGSSDETGLGSGESVRDYAKEYYKGTILSEATIIRNDGANDGVAGFSYALKPRASSTKESMLGLDTPWFGGIVEGDASTSKDFTINIANDSGSDLTKADVWVELASPSAVGVTQHDFDFSSRTAIDASAADVTDDTASDWSTGAGGKNAQKIVITATPDFTGPVYARVIFAQAGTTTCYVDPKVHVTDT